MAAMLETPSRIWRRIEAVEDRDMPSLPSLPSFEDSVDSESVIHHDYDGQLQEDEDSVTHHDYDDQLLEEEGVAISHHDYDDQILEEEDLVTSHHDSNDQLQEDEDPVTPHRDYDDHFREDLVTPHQDYDDQLQEDEDPVTPHTRRRSFLLDIINSTARPRMKFPTPHPRKFGTPSITESTPRPGASNGGSFLPGPSLQSAFTGVTYRRPRLVPTRRMSHPLSQAISASSPGISESEASPISGENPVPRATPSLSSPYDGNSDRASFISTASSHDLTSHHRVNTSFDPAMGFGAGAPGHGVGRFNAAKLNNYLHGLNRRLQQENEDLIERLKILEEEKKEEGASRRVSSVRMSLGKVQEDVAAEGWLEEKAELGDMVEKFKTELTTCMAEKKEVETALEQEKESRERDKERWRERMTEVEQGVSGIIGGLEQKLQAAEKQNKKVEEEASQRVDEVAKELVEIRGDRDMAMERASKAERTTANLEQKLQAAERWTKQAEDEASQRVKEMAKELIEIRGDRDMAMERASKAERTTATLEQKLQAAERQTKKAEDEASQRVKEIAKELIEIRGDRDMAMERASKAERVLESGKDLGGALREANEHVAQVMGDLRNANAQIKELEEEIMQSDGRIDDLERDQGEYKDIIANLEEELSSRSDALAADRAKMKQLEGTIRKLDDDLTSKITHIDEMVTDLQRTESDMDDVKQQLQKLKKENHDLEKELRENANMEQKAHLMETRVVESAETIGNLRQELSLLSTDHKALKRRFAEISEVANNLRSEYGAHSQSHDNHRHELDLRRLEIDDLRRALDDRASDLQHVEKEKDKIATEKSDVARTVASLEADLKRVRRDAETFGQDLKLLRMENDKLKTKHKDEISKADRSKKQAQTQVRLLNEQLEMQKENILKARGEIKNHTCAAEERQASKMKLQHNKECKGLIVQIRYLEAKFIRESVFRSDLTYQKQYLLVLLTQFERSEQTIFASIARIGFPVALPQPCKKVRKLKSLVLMIIFLSRVKRSSTVWKEHRSSKQAVAAALEDVRRKRALVV